jgi:Methyltransferase domain
VFFDDYPLFYETSETAVSARRLNLRHHAMIENNRDVLAGARVLDLASHDGRWSFAALKAGAAHVTGVEARRELVDNARKTFAEYGVPSDTYRFIRGDMFRVLARREMHVDVVMCFGFVYHTLRYPELFRAIMDVRPRHVLLDTKVIRGNKPLVRLRVNRTGVQSAAAPDQTTHGRRAIAGWPSVSALSMMLDIYGLEVEEQYDWPALLAVQQGGRDRSLGDYFTGHRVTMRCRARPEEAATPEARRTQPSRRRGKPNGGAKRRRDRLGIGVRPGAFAG